MQSPTFGEMARKIVFSVQEIYPAPKQAYESLYQDILQIFAKHNKPSPTKEELAAYKSELDERLGQFKKQHPQRFFVYQDPFGF